LQYSPIINASSSSAIIIAINVALAIYIAIIDYYYGS